MAALLSQPGNNKMKDVFVAADNIYSPLGVNSADNFEQLCRGNTGITGHQPGNYSPQPFYASLFDGQQPSLLPAEGEFTRFEQILLRSVADALQQANIDPADPRTGLILSSTKGNISLLEAGTPLSAQLQARISLPASARLVASRFGFRAAPVVVSHACISGLVALITGMRMLQEGIYDQVVVTGADIITRFILSGFQSFQAISDEPCRPFDARRKGINLGEGAATVILSVSRPQGHAIRITGGSVSNDANHISGPSRTGAELYQAMAAAMRQAGITAGQVDMISAHGTATLYNDDMESKAIRQAGLQQVPVNSLKGYYGHTLGAAGLIEIVIAIHSLRNNKVIPTKGFEVPGTSENINVCSTLQPGFLKTCLKTASGFGGCNAAVVLQKDE